MSRTSNTATLIVADSKQSLPAHLTSLIASLSRQAIAARGSFTIALSGGSLPSFLSTLPQSFGSTTSNQEDSAQWEKWHILLADERCVPETHDDSNLKSLRQNFLSSVGIPPAQVYGIDQSKVDESSTEAVAEEYERRLRSVLAKSGGYLDLAVLGFGPDGHTCSLFPHHPVLQESSKLVAPITDSPKPPPNRVTLTFPVLNQYTRHVIICGAGTSKGPILRHVVTGISQRTGDDSYGIPHGQKYTASIQRAPAPFPCAMVQPVARIGGEPTTLTWIVDRDATQEANLQLDSAM